MIGGAVQLGALAACVVVLVPMVMAGYHLSRNKMLFFGCALFITLAVGVHLTPYFPSSSSSAFNDFVTTVSSVVVFENRRDSCVKKLHDVTWDVTLVDDGNDTTTVNYRKSWAWDPPDNHPCGFQRLLRRDAADLLNGSWIVVAGDSQARLLALSLLGLILDSDSGRMEKVRDDMFKRHSNYQIVIDEIGMRLDFFWAPYALNLTTLLQGFNRNQNYPDVILMGSGLWHMLHFTNASDFRLSLQSLRSNTVSLVQSTSEERQTKPHLFWIGMPTLINSMLNTDEKRERMTDAMRAAYDEQLRKSNLLRKSSNPGPFVLLDVESLSWNCGVRCTVDGMHYDMPVYEAALQIMLNALLLESHQKL